MYIKYVAISVGPMWLLQDEDWYALEADGWRVCWAGTAKDRDLPVDDSGLPQLRPHQPDYLDAWTTVDEQGRLRQFGALARRAFYRSHTIEEALVSFRRVTGRDPAVDLVTYAHCSSRPHDFTRWTDTHELVDWWEP